MCIRDRVEPLRQLFKDEVRACGLELGLPHDMVFRQPFPGPGLGVRCLGAITKDRLEAVRESDAILREEFATAGLDQKVWQYFTIVPDFKSVGVKNNARSFEYPVILRAVNTIDAMTASIEDIDWPVLHSCLLYTSLDLIFQNLWLLSAVSAHSATLAGKQRRVVGDRAGRGLLPACISAKHTAAYAYLSPGR